jgi:nucleotide-binding universal stress UspA family protein
MREPLSRLLVVVNGSESSIGAARYALELAAAYESQVTMVYVVDTATIKQLALSRIFVPDESVEYEESLERSGRRILAYMQELAAARKIEVSTTLRRGAVPGEVVALADELGAGAIILGGTDRKNQFKDALLDVYSEIVRNAPCPVMIIKGRAVEKASRA